MSNRDDLARLIFRVDNWHQPEQDNAEDWAALDAAQHGRTYAHRIADGLLEAGWTPPGHAEGAGELPAPTPT